MIRCENCGYEGTKDEVKLAPSNIPKYRGKFICLNCYRKLRKIEKEKINSENKKRFRYDGERLPPTVPERNINLKKNKKMNIGFTEAEPPLKKYHILLTSSFLIMVIAILLIANQFGLFSTVLSNSEESKIIGTWELQDMSGPADDLFNQKWTFYQNNNTLKIITDYKKGSDNDKIDNLLWEIEDDKLQISIPFSKFGKKPIFNVELTCYDVKFSNQKMTLTCQSSIGLKTEMCLKKI